MRLFRLGRNLKNMCDLERHKVDMGVDNELPWREWDIHQIMLHLVEDAWELKRLSRKALPVGNVLLGLFGDKGNMQSNDPMVFFEGCGGGFGGGC